MTYRPSFSPLSKASAVFSASLKAGATGAIIIALSFAAMSAASSTQSGFDLGAIFGIFLFAFVVGLVVGTSATALCLFLFGMAIAHIARDVLSDSEGVVISILGALAITGLLCLLVQEVRFAFLALPFAIPAALFFRNDILVEEAFD